MITARSATARYGTDSIAQNVRAFIAPSARLESQPAAAEAGKASSNLDLALLYPSIFGAAPQVSQGMRKGRPAFGSI